MKNFIKNSAKKLLTAITLSAFLFNANFTVIETVSAQWNDSDWTTDNTTNYVYNPNTYTNPNVDYVNYGCEYSGTCGNTGGNNWNGGSSWNDSDWTTDNTTNYVYNPNTYTNPNVDYVNYGCEYSGTCGNTGGNNWNGGSSWNDNNVYNNNSNNNNNVINNNWANSNNNNSWNDNSWNNTPIYNNTPVYNNNNNWNTTPVYTPNYNQQSYTCWNGQVVYNLNSCPAQQQNPVYNTPIYNTPVYNTPIYQPQTPVQQTYVCWNGQVVYSLNSCPAQVQNPIGNPGRPVAPIQQPVTPVQQTYICWNGQTVYSLASCPAQTKTCQNGTTVPVSNTCTKTCFGGQAVPETSRCTSTCPDGSIIEEGQSCPFIVTNLYCALNNETYYSQASYNQNCRKYCSINGYYYSTINEYNNSCRNLTKTCINGQVIPVEQTCVDITRTCPNGQVVPSTQNCPETTRFCALNGSSYPQSTYDQNCRKYCTFNTFYYATQSDFDAYCRAPVSLYCAINNQNYNNQSDYAQNCRKYCSINGYYYASQSEYDNSCRESTRYCELNNQSYPVGSYNESCRKYCTVNNNYYYNLNDYNNSCRLATVSLYCALNNETYSSQDSYNQNCRKYCTVNGYYYTSQNEYNNYCKASTPVISHRVVTTIPTQITTTSARCNAVAIIGGNMSTTGYFEYGTTQSLGYTTNQANIGSQSSTAYSNVISGLKPNTTYYCKAVITNQNGTYKGETMSFKTDSSYVPYVPAPVIHNPKPVKTTTVVKGKKVTKYVAPKAGEESITCKDFEGNTSTMKAGEKLMSLDISKTQGSLSPDGTVEYTLKYKNTSRLTLSNVKVKVTLPTELSVQNTNTGSLDANTNTLTVSIGDVDALSDSYVKVIAKVSKGAEVGRTVIINSYISYELLDSKNKVMRDENTAYLVSTIVADSDMSAKDINSKSDMKSDKNGNSILPDTLLEWLAIIVLMFVLAILGRVIYTNLKGGDVHVHH